MTHRHAPGPRPAPPTGYALLPGEPVLPVQRQVAELVGDCAAHLLYHLKYLLFNFGAVLDGRPDDGPWVLATYDDWHDDLSWYSKGTIIRAVKELEREGYVETRHVAGVTNAKWYSLHEDRVQAAVAERFPARPGPRGVLKRLLNLRSRPPAAPPDGVCKSAPARRLEPPRQTVAPDPPAQIAQSGLRNLRSPDCGPCAVRTAHGAQPLHIEKENGGELGRTEAAAAHPRTAERAGPLTTAAAAAPAAREGEGVGASPPPAADPAAVAALVAAGFDPADAAAVAAISGATGPWVEWLHRKAAKRLARDPGTDVRAYVVAGLRRGWRPPPASAAAPPPPPAKVAADRQRAERIRDVADAEVRVVEERARVDADLAALAPGVYDAIAADVLPRQPEPVRVLVAKRGRDCWALRIAVHDEVVRRRRAGLAAAAATAVLAPASVPSLPPDPPDPPDQGGPRA